MFEGLAPALQPLHALTSLSISCRWLLHLQNDGVQTAQRRPFASVIAREVKQLPLLTRLTSLTITHLPWHVSLLSAPLPALQTLDMSTDFLSYDRAQHQEETQWGLSCRGVTAEAAAAEAPSSTRLVEQSRIDSSYVECFQRSQPLPSLTQLTVAAPV